MRKLLVALMASALANPALATGPVFSNSGGVGSATSTLSGTPREPTGGTFSIDGTTGKASINLLNVKPGSPPSSPVNGDLWTTNGGVFARINGVTRGPFISKEASGVDIYLDGVAGTDSSTCGTGTGAAACKTLPQVVRNLCVNYNHSGVPTIHGVAGQTYTKGLAFKAGFAGADSTPSCDGIPTVIFDGHGSTIDSTDGNGLMLYYVPMTLVAKNVTVKTVNAGQGSPALCRGGGGTMIFAGGVTLDQAPAIWPQAWAYGGCQMATSPSSITPGNTLTFKGGGHYAALAGEGGAFQLEGANIVFTGTPDYPGGVFSAFDGGVGSLVSSPITGAATGRQFVVSMGGVLNINAQTGGYSACAALSYLPGDKCGQTFGGGIISQGGTPTATGCGTGCTVQGTDRSFVVTFGSGLGSTDDTTYGPARFTFATATNIPACSLKQSDPALANHWISIAPPIGSANGYIEFTWKGTGAAPTGKSLYVVCEPG